METDIQLRAAIQKEYEESIERAMISNENHLLDATCERCNEVFTADLDERNEMMNVHGALVCDGCLEEFS